MDYFCRSVGISLWKEKIETVSDELVNVEQASNAEKKNQRFLLGLKGVRGGGGWREA